MKLIVVESPGKIKKLQSFLGPGHRVVASFGHVRDLPEKDLGVDIAGTPDHPSVKPHYQTIARNSKYVTALRHASKDADEVILATDPDREGEAIAWHVAAILGGNPENYARIEFNSITRDAVLRALANPRRIDLNMVDAQQARRVLDRLVGWMVSPYCWRRIGSGTSAGRVQSVAVRLVAEREQDIRAFKVETYHELWAWLWTETSKPAKPAAAHAVSIEVVTDLPDPPPSAFRAKLIELNGKEIARTLAEPAWALDLRARLLPASWRVTDVKKSERIRRPPLPFITSTFQQAASVRLRTGAKPAMKAAQTLYERGLITYMRTDSPTAAPEAVRAARDFIAENFAPAFLPSSPRFYRAGKDAQAAHECIRPTDICKLPRDVEDSGLGIAARFYRLIWERFIASQMSDAIYDDTVATIEATAPAAEGSPAVNALFEAKGSVQRFPGWLALTQRDASSEDPDSDDGRLPELANRQPLDLARLDVRRTQTEPPKRYTQASLIKALEKEGIGRPATYASILDTIMTRGYVEDIQRSLHATPLGESLVKALKQGFSGHFIEVGFTRDAEEELDAVAEGKTDWQSLVVRFRDAIAAKLADAPNGEVGPGTAAPSGTLRRPTTRSLARPTSHESPSTPPPSSSPPPRGRKTSARSTFGRAIPPSLTLIPGGLGAEGGLPNRQPVPNDFDRFENDASLPPSILPGPPDDADRRSPPPPRRAPPEPDPSAPPCPKCGGPMVARTSTFGPFFGCQKYPACKGVVDPKGPRKGGFGKSGGKGGWKGNSGWKPKSPSGSFGDKPPKTGEANWKQRSSSGLKRKKPMNRGGGFKRGAKSNRSGPTRYRPEDNSPGRQPDDSPF